MGLHASAVGTTHSLTNNLDVWVVRSDARDQAPNATEAVDTDADRHVEEESGE
jgi:hypothetical protein